MQEDVCDVLGRKAETNCDVGFIFGGRAACCDRARGLPQLNKYQLASCPSWIVMLPASVLLVDYSTPFFCKARLSKNVLCTTRDRRKPSYAFTFR